MPELPAGASLPARRAAALWLLFFLMAAGLGYPSLRRFDPRDPRTNFDRSHTLYHAQVTGDQAEASDFPPTLHYRYRLLVPMVARPFYLLGRGHIGTWEPGFFGLLMANAIFCASTTVLLYLLARRELGDPLQALLPSLVYLLSFAVANYHLAGLVDAGEAAVLTGVVWCLRHGRWMWLPLLGIVGAFAKETFVPLSVALAVGWLVAEDRGAAFPRRLVSIVLLGLAGLATLTATFSWGNGRLVLPWELARSGYIGGAYSGVLARAGLLSRDLGLLYLFGWLAPLGVPSLGRCPRPWVAGALVSAGVVVILGLYNGEPGVSRSLFNVLGPLLSLATAFSLAGLLRASPARVPAQ